MNELTDDSTESLEYKRDHAIKLFQNLSPLFLALGDGFRQEIIVELSEHPEGRNVTELTKNKSLSRPAISYHLKVLKESGLVTTKKKSTQVYYFLNFDNFYPKIEEFIAAIQSVKSAAEKAGG